MVHAFESNISRMGFQAEPDPRPTLDYQPKRSLNSERAQKLRRIWKKVFWVGVCVMAVPVLLIGGKLLYELCRHHTTVEEVQQWMATLPPTATPAEVEQLYALHGMRCIRVGPRWGLTPSAPDVVPSDGFGREGILDDAEEGWMEVRVIEVTVYFDGDNRLKSINVETHWIGP
jgi:hypothetical protein